MIMHQRNVSAPAVTDSVAAVVKYVVEKAFSTDEEFFSGSEARSLGNKRDEFLKSGPDLPTLYREINGIATLKAGRAA